MTVLPCRVCGGLFRRRTRSVYCSDACRMAWKREYWRRQSKARYVPVVREPKSVAPIRVCSTCTRPVLGASKEFCSRTCRGVEARRVKERRCARCSLPWRPKKPLSFHQDLCWNCRCLSHQSPREVFSGVKERQRKRLLAREGGRCQDCGATAGLESHHTVPVALGGTHGLDNLELLCAECHRGEGWYRHHFLLVEAGLVIPPADTQLVLAA